MNKILITVEGGNIVSVETTRESQIYIVDWDNIRDGDLRQLDPVPQDNLITSKIIKERCNKIKNTEQTAENPIFYAYRGTKSDNDQAVYEPIFNDDVKAMTSHNWDELSLDEQDRVINLFSMPEKF